MHPWALFVRPIVETCKSIFLVHPDVSVVLSDDPSLGYEDREEA